MKYRGRDIELYVQDNREIRKIAHSTSCELDISRSLTLTSGLFDKSWNGYHKGRSSWTIRCEVLQTDDVDYLRKLLLTGKAVYIKFFTATRSKMGKAIVQNIGFNDQVRDVGRISVLLRGIGRLTEGDDLKRLIYNSDFFELDLTLINY